jgi:hypothetical protein
MVCANLLVCGSVGDSRRGVLGVRKLSLNGGRCLEAGGITPEPGEREKDCNYRFQGKRRNDEVWLRAVLLYHQHMLGHRSGFAAEREMKLEGRSPTTEQLPRKSTAWLDAPHCKRRREHVIVSDDEAMTGNDDR